MNMYSQLCKDVFELFKMSHRNYSMLNLTLCLKKGSHLMSDNNFGKCGPIFKIFHQLIHKKFSMHRLQRFPTRMQYVATLIL